MDNIFPAKQCRKECLLFSKDGGLGAAAGVLSQTGSKYKPTPGSDSGNGRAKKLDGIQLSLDKTYPDVRLAHQLKSLNIPYILPGLILYRLLKDRKTDYKTTVWALRQLSEYISDDEFATVRLLMEK